MKKIIILILLALPNVAWSETVYLKPSEALQMIFADSKEIGTEAKLLTPDEKKSIEKQLGQSIAKDKWNVYIAKTASKIDGYAVIDNEVGKTEPITFLTAILPNGQVKAVEILVYRESHGGEVKDKKFLQQYKGKTVTDPVRTGVDISNISGATLSSRAISRGVKRALLVWKQFYGKK